MSKHGLEVFDHTLQTTYEWINDLLRILNWSDRQKGYLVLRCTLQALRDRLPIELAVKFGAQLPMLIRGFYYEGWIPGETPVKIKNLEEFLEFVSAHATNANLAGNTDVEQAVRAVFEVIGNHVSQGEVEHLRRALPPQLATLWAAR